MQSVFLYILFLNYGAVELIICRGSLVPAEIVSHGDLYSVEPAIAAVMLMGSAYGVEHIFRMEALESVAVAAGFREIVYGIFKPAGLPYYRNGSVAERDHLGKTAGFALARHK